MPINLINGKRKKKNVEQDYNIANLSWYDPDHVTNEVLFNETAKAASLHGWLALLGRIFEKISETLSLNTRGYVNRSGHVSEGNSVNESLSLSKMFSPNRMTA